MVDASLDPPRAATALRPYLEPVLRHAGWFGFFLVLAPIIGPRGYGLFILALSGIAIAEGLLAETAIQALADRAVLEARHLSTALVTTIAAGAALSLMLHAMALAIGPMVDEMALGDIFQSLTLLPLLGALAVVPSAMLRRERRRAPFVAASVAGLAAGGSVAVALAWAGAGAWSLVAQIIVQRFLECAVLWGMVHESVGIAWSRSHFVELLGALNLRTLAAAYPAVSLFGPCLLVGLLLGPTATGIYMLAARLAEALGDICFAKPASVSRNTIPQIVRRGCQVLLPAVLGSALLAIGLPPLLDVRWWGAVRPAQVLLLGAIPAAVMFVRSACTDNAAAETRWWTMQALGGIAVAAFAAPYGLTALAATSLLQVAAMALASLWPIQRALGIRWHEAIAAAVRPSAGAAAAGFLLLLLADPVGLRLDPVAACALLTASGWLSYLVIRGEPIAQEVPTPVPLGRRLDRTNPV
jgi:hypothetical protein